MALLTPVPSYQDDCTENLTSVKNYISADSFYDWIRDQYLFWCISKLAKDLHIVKVHQLCLPEHELTCSSCLHLPSLSLEGSFSSPRMECKCCSAGCSVTLCALQNYCSHCEVPNACSVVQEEGTMNKYRFPPTCRNEKDNNSGKNTSSSEANGDALDK